EPITEYEKERALKVMRNNKMLSSLGITGLTSLIRSSNTRKNSIAQEDFDPLYEPDHSEDNGHHVSDKGQFAVNTKNKDVRFACADVMMCVQRQMRYKLKKAYFNGVAADKVRTTSPLSTMTDEQWMQLVNMWSTPKHKDTMESLMGEHGVEGKESKTPIEAVAQVLASSKFLQNIGLVPATKKSSNGGDPTRVADLEAELESEKQNTLEVRAQLDALKKK
ncbi:hypothetical protein ACJX0J_030910, partial [Zea mays]